MKPTVVQAITRLNIGGPARHVLGVTSGLSHRYTFRVATGTAPPVEGELSSVGLAVDRLPLVRSLSPHRDVAALTAMRQLLRHHSADLVHSHMAKAGSVARLAASTLHPRPRTIHTFHGHVLAGYFGPRAEAVFAHVERKLAGRSDRLVAVSEDIRDALLDLGIGRRAQYEVIPLGLDLEPYLKLREGDGALRRSLNVPDDRPLVAVVARLAPVKDHMTLLRALVDVPHAHLAVIGDGELRDSLTATASHFGLADRVHFTGWQHDMPTALAGVDAVVLTSRNEGTPMALIEAAAAGRPVVATAVGGMARVVLDGRTGMLVPPGDPGAVASALDRLLEDPALRRRMGERARAHAQQNFGQQTSLDRLSALYDDVLAQGPSPGRRSRRRRR